MHRSSSSRYRPYLCVVLPSLDVLTTADETGSRARIRRSLETSWVLRRRVVACRTQAFAKQCHLPHRKDAQARPSLSRRGDFVFFRSQTRLTLSIRAQRQSPFCSCGLRWTALTTSTGGKFERCPQNYTGNFGRNELERLSVKWNT